MIECPECGKMISSKALYCVHCGVPLQVNKSVKIKIPRFITGLLSQKSSEAELYCNDNLLWNGFSGQTAGVEIETEEANVRIRIKKAATGHPFPFFRDFEMFGLVRQGKRYEIKIAKTSLGFDDLTKYSWVLSEVDAINSEI